MPTLDALDENLWSLGALLPFPGGLRLPVRMTVIRSRAGAVMLHSPLRMQAETVAEVRALGTVTELFGPNRYHHRFLRDALDHFPEAAIYGAPGLPAKRKNLRFAGEIGGSADLPERWRGELEAVTIEGAPRLNEVVLFHRPSATLITTDLFFNVVSPATFVTKLALTTMGTRGRFAQSRWWRLYTRDRERAARAAEQMLQWDFRRVLMAHGDPVVDDAHARTEAALAWMLRPLARRPPTDGAK